MELLKPDTYIDFMRYRVPVIGTSLTLLALSLGSLIWPGPKLGLDFAGGTELELQFTGPVSTAELRDALEAAGHPGADVVIMLGGNETPAVPEEVKTAIGSRLASALGDVEVLQYKVSPGGDKISLRLSGPADLAVIRGAIEGEGNNGVEGGGVTQFGRSGGGRRGGA